MGHRFLIPTGISASLDEGPWDNLNNFAGFASADAVIGTLAKHMPEQEAEDLVEGPSGYAPWWFLDELAEAQANELRLELQRAELDAIAEEEARIEAEADAWEYNPWPNEEVQRGVIF
ncbi:MAG: hypothetical protein ABR884_03710 [Minisyncoccia bacterium]|jgi:hypothetical protein